MESIAQDFPLLKVSPFLTPQEYAQYISVNRGEGLFNRVFSYKEVLDLIEGELSIYKEVKPDAVVSANITSSISCEIAQISIVMPTGR